MQLRGRASGAWAALRRVWIGRLGFIVVAAWVIGLASPPVHAQRTIVSSGHVAEGKNMRLLGHHDLQARSAYQPVIYRQGARWIAYVGHHGGAAMNALTGTQEGNGTSIVDVTDPANPTYVHHIPGEQGIGEAGGAQMVRLCHGQELPNGDATKVYLLRTLGNSAHQVWDVTVPERPSLLTTVVSGLKGTHKNWWECDTGIALLVSGAPDWRSRRMTQIYDLSDPTKPVFIRNFGLVGQQPGATGPVPTELHGPISTGRQGNRVYFGYGTSSGGILQIVDREKLLNGPKEPTPENLRYPQVARLDLQPFNGAHTTFPVLGVEVPEFAKDAKGQKRDFVVIVNESTRNECTDEARQMMFVVDVTDETKPFAVANYQVRQADGGFCARGGRFGAHASHENFTPIYYKRMMFFSWFNAGVRAVDIRDPYQPREVAYYIPATTEKTTPRCLKTAEGERCKIAIQTNNVEVDDRGLIYLVDRADTGMHILELSGEARDVANLPR